MNDAPWPVRHIDLADQPQALAPATEGEFLMFWWRTIPLGARPFVAEELPLSAASLVAIGAELIARQAGAREAEGRGIEAGSDGHPADHLPLAQARDAAGLTAALDAMAAAPAVDAGGLSVIVCTRDRPELLARCLERLSRQAAPAGEILVVDNSQDRSAEPVARAIGGLRYVHEPRPGLSIARNAGVRAAMGRLIAFTDDDVEVHPGWTGETVRAFADPEVDAVAGLVAPTVLDTAAQRYFELELNGFGGRFTPMRFGQRFLEETRSLGPQVWRIGAGANMAFRREAFERFGLFDERLGAGASGCSEDSEFWYRILAGGGTCAYEPRAVVFHRHRDDWPTLRRQLRAYMTGHVSALIAQTDRYGDRSNLRRIWRQLPAYFLRTGMIALRDGDRRRLGCLSDEVRGWLGGLQYLVRPGWRAASAVPALRPTGA